MADGTPLKKIGALLVAGTAMGALVLGPAPALADDIESFGGDIVVTVPREQEEQARGISRMSLPVAQSSQVGTWVEVKRSESTYILQMCSYYISPNANPDGSVNVTVKTTMYNKASNSGIFWTTTKTLYDNGNRCAFIGEDWNSRAYLHESISEEATFSVRGGGIHRITSTETTFRGSAETTSGWDFTINIPFTICASAGEGGSISPSGATLVSTGESRNYDIAADSGWRIKDVTVDGSSVGPQGSYTFSNVSSDHTISASFQKVWNVKFIDGITGEVIGEQVVDAGSAATPPRGAKARRLSLCGMGRRLLAGGKRPHDNVSTRARYLRSRSGTSSLQDHGRRKRRRSQWLRHRESLGRPRSSGADRDEGHARRRHLYAEGR